MQSQICSKLLFLEQRNDCINSDLLTSQHTMHWYLCLPMIPVLLGTCKLPLCIQWEQVGNGSSYMGRGWLNILILSGQGGTVGAY
jgi:hypothetical protein